LGHRRNLISNALKFTPADGTVDVKTTYIPDGLPDAKPLLLSDRNDDAQVWSSDYPRAGSIQITVKDSGIGLTKAQLAKLFEEGVQFDANRLQHGGGSGLGLAIAKGMVEQHSGTIRAESEGQGSGTTFIIELPLYEVPPEEVSGGNSEASPGSSLLAMPAPVTTTTTIETDINQSDVTLNASERRRSTRPMKKEIKKLRILVAEDAVSSLKMMIRLLERAGHTCVGTENGKEALEAIQTDLLESKTVPNHVPFDIVLVGSSRRVVRLLVIARNLGLTILVVFFFPTDGL
jgi:CheY-like chemotaxis protein